MEVKVENCDDRVVFYVVLYVDGKKGGVKKEKDKNCEVVVKRPWVLTVGHVPAIAPAVCNPVSVFVARLVLIDGLWGP